MSRFYSAERRFYAMSSKLCCWDMRVIVVANSGSAPFPAHRKILPVCVIAMK